MKPPTPDINHRSRHFIWMLGIALSTLVLAIAVALAFIFIGTEKWQLLGFRILELSIQVALVTVLGGVLVQAYIRWHARTSSINEFRKSTAEAVIREYSAVKKVRRLIRASCVQGAGGTEMDPWTDIPKDVYDHHMSYVIDAQLALELVKRRLRLLGDAFNGSKDLSEKAETMEDYLSDIIGEYEKQRHRQLTQDPIPLKNLERLRAFIAGKPDTNPVSDFNNKFRIPFDKLLERLEKEGVWVAI